MALAPQIKSVLFLKFLRELAVLDEKNLLIVLIFLLMATEATLLDGSIPKISVFGDLKFLSSVPSLEPISMTFLVF